MSARATWPPSISNSPVTYVAMVLEPGFLDHVRDVGNYMRQQLAGLPTTLPSYYETVLGQVRGAPVVVLSDVEVRPNTGRSAASCLGALPGFDPHEFTLVRWLQVELNRQIAGAVTAG